MLTVSSLVEFLMSLLRDDDLRAEFERDPEGVLASHGLDDVCATDVTDAVPLVADRTDVHPVGGSSAPADADPVVHITNITENYQADPPADVPDVYNYNYVDDRDTIVNVDDRDTTNIQAGGDVTIEDSFNQDNDGLDNKGGSIDDSVATGDDVEADPPESGQTEGDPTSSTLETEEQALSMTFQDTEDADAAEADQPTDQPVEV